MRKFSFLLGVLVLFLTQVYAQDYKITGQLTGFRNGTRIKLIDEDSENTINSTTLKQGKFILKGKLKAGPQYFLLTLPDYEEMECTVFVGEGPVNINGSKKAFDKVRMTGTTEQAAYNIFQQALKPYISKMISAAHLADKVSKDSVAYKKAFAAYQSSCMQIDSVSKKFTLDHLNYYYAVNHVYDKIKEMPRDSALKLYNGLKKPLQQSLYGQRINNYLSIGDTLKINDSYVDFEAINQFGKQQKLSDMKGKYILLDFSFAACNPCHQSIPELKTLSAKYSKNLDIVSFTVDNRKDWLQGIKDDHISWPSLYDGKGNYSKAILKYGVQGFPTFVLISPDGKLVDKWVGYDKSENNGKPIEQHLKKHL